ncbi:hypothetical protein CSPAE12_02415, partial [Colletotrichum incanum]
FNNLEATLRQKKVARTTFLNSERPPSTKSPVLKALINKLTIIYTKLIILIKAKAETIALVITIAGVNSYVTITYAVTLIKKPLQPLPLTNTLLKSSKAGRANICFSNRERILLSGTIVVPTPFRPINFYVVPINTPFLLCLTDIDRIRIFFNNLTNII